jgi:hypothetical protein
LDGETAEFALSLWQSLRFCEMNRHMRNSIGYRSTFSDDVIGSLSLSKKKKKKQKPYRQLAIKKVVHDRSSPHSSLPDLVPKHTFRNNSESPPLQLLESAKTETMKARFWSGPEFNFGRSFRNLPGRYPIQNTLVIAINVSSQIWDDFRFIDFQFTLLIMR